MKHKTGIIGWFYGHVLSPSELAKLIAMASSGTSGSVGSSSTSLETCYDVIESSASEEESQDTHVQAQVVSLFSSVEQVASASSV